MRLRSVVSGSRAFVRDLSADKLSPRALPCVFFLAFPLTQLVGSSTTPPRAVFCPYRTSPPGRPSPPSGSCPVRGADSGGAEPAGAESGGAEPGGLEPGGAETGGAVSGGPSGTSSRRELPSPQELREWFARRWSRASGAGGAFSAADPAVAAGGAGATGPGGARTGGTGAVGTGVLLGLLELVLLEVLQVLLGVLELLVLLGVLELLGVLVLEVMLGLVLLRVLELALLELEVLLALVLPLGVLVPSLLFLEALSGRGRTSFRSLSKFLSPLFLLLLTLSLTLFVLPVLLAELVDFAAHCRLDYAASLVAEFDSVCPPSVGGECALSMDVLEDKQEEFQCFAAALPHLVSMLIAPKRDPDAPDIPTPQSYAEAIEGPYSSQWQSAMDAEMASWKSTGTYVDEVPPPGVNIVSGMWIFRVKRPPGSPPVFKARYVARGFTAQRDYELHSLDFSTPFLQGSLHEEIWLRHPPGFTGSFPPGTQWSLQRPVYGLRQAPREWHDTLKTTLAALRFAPSTADPSLFLRTDTSLPPFYILVYVNDLVFATADTAGLAHVKSELQKRHTCIDLALPLDESVEPSGPYPELVAASCTDDLHTI
ncbi:unnamed protein product [Closterium sp. NIES-64]|nr:unnamed protein product [Closterium sp. NIES-64]